MIVLHRKTLEGAELASLPDLSMQFARSATHYLATIALRYSAVWGVLSRRCDLWDACIHGESIRFTRLIINQFFCVILFFRKRDLLDFRKVQNLSL